MNYSSNIFGTALCLFFGIAFFFGIIVPFVFWDYIFWVFLLNYKSFLNYSYQNLCF